LLIFDDQFAEDGPSADARGLEVEAPRSPAAHPFVSPDGKPTDGVIALGTAFSADSGSSTGSGLVANAQKVGSFP
jgi:hypothetical protein